MTYSPDNLPPIGARVLLTLAPIAPEVADQPGTVVGYGHVTVADHGPGTATHGVVLVDLDTDRAAVNWHDADTGTAFTVRTITAHPDNIKPEV